MKKWPFCSFRPFAATQASLHRASLRPKSPCPTSPGGSMLVPLCSPALCPIHYGDLGSGLPISFFRGVLLKLPPRGLLKTERAQPHHKVARFGRSRVRTREPTCVSNKSPGHVDAAASGATLAEHRFKTMSFFKRNFFNHSNL